MNGHSNDSLTKKNASPHQTLGNRPFKRRRDPWLGKTVQIKRGKFKQYKGIVKNCTDTKLTIELSARAKTVSVKRDMVRVLNPDGSVIEDTRTARNSTGAPRKRGFGSLLNNFGKRGSRTPRGGLPSSSSTSSTESSLIGAKTPAYALGSATPAMGGVTPGYGGVTPAHGTSARGTGSAWDANVGGFTPASGGDSDFPSSASLGTSTASAMSSGGHLSASSPAYGYLSASQTNHSQGMASGSASSSGMSSVYGYSSHGGHDTSDIGSGAASATGVTIHDSLTTTEQSESDSGGLGKNGFEDRSPYYFIVKGAHLKESATGQVVIVRSVNATSALVTRVSTGEQASLLKSDLQHIPPTEGDRVRSVVGHQTGKEGNCIGIDGLNCIVKLNSEGIEFISSANLVKI